jgi:UDP-glucose 4-epimerase
MRILVTGGAGFIGSHVVDLLINNNHEVIVIDNLSNGKLENINKKAKFIKEDLINHEKINKVFETFKPEVVYHFAAQIDLRKSIDDPVEDAKINVLSTINLLELCRKYNTKHFIFSSSAAVYGETENLPTKEEEKTNPVSPYGINKLIIEKYLDFYNKSYDLKYTILRFSNVYGPRQDSNGEAGVVAIFFNRLKNNTPPIIFGGSQTRDFVYVKDVAKANILALQDSKSDTYNVSTGVETSINELYNKITRILNKDIKPEILKFNKKEQMRSCLDNSKIKKELGWVPEFDLEKGLEEMI